MPNHAFNFEALKNGQLGLTPRYGAFLAEAAAHCLEVNSHPNPVPMAITGDVLASSTLDWEKIQEQRAGTYADLQEATEYGACAVAITVAVELTGFSRVQRSAKSTGIDFWLVQGTDETGIFQRAARLEVSGILKGTSAINARTKKKLKQTEPTDATALPAYAGIVEFSSPETRLAKKKFAGRKP